MTLKFRSPNGDDLHIALTSGHTALITPEGVDLDPMFHREAIARGALAGDTPAALGASAPQFNRKQVITDAINAMMDGDDEEDFNADGKPALRRLSSRAGFQVEREEADAIFEEITKAASQG